jgi:hypothetical protein
VPVRGRFAVCDVADFTRGLGTQALGTNGLLYPLVLGTPADPDLYFLVRDDLPPDVDDFGAQRQAQSPAALVSRNR